MVGYANCKGVDVTEFFSTNCDILIPAALELQITDEIASKLRCDAIFEAANGPMDTDAENIVLSTGILSAQMYCAIPEGFW